MSKSKFKFRHAKLLMSTRGPASSFKSVAGRPGGSAGASGHPA